MDIAKQRIDAGVNKKSRALDISDLGLTKIPDNLPGWLEILDCSENQITELKDFPNSLQTLDCSRNQITELKDLPHSLQTLNCSKNQITELKDLPNSLQTLS